MMAWGHRPAAQEGAYREKESESFTNCMEPRCNRQSSWYRFGDKWAEEGNVCRVGLVCNAKLSGRISSHREIENTGR
jgi:hypothetical protein